MAVVSDAILLHQSRATHAKVVVGQKEVVRQGGGVRGGCGSRGWREGGVIWVQGRGSLISLLSHKYSKGLVIGIGGGGFTTVGGWEGGGGGLEEVRVGWSWSWYRWM